MARTTVWIGGAVLVASLWSGGCAMASMHGMSHTRGESGREGTALRTSGPAESGNLGLSLEVAPVVAGRPAVLTVGVTQGPERAPLGEALVAIRVARAAGSASGGQHAHGSGGQSASGQVPDPGVELVPTPVPGAVGTYRTNHTFAEAGAYEISVSLLGNQVGGPPLLSMKGALHVSASEHDGASRLTRWTILGGLAMIASMVVRAVF